MSDTSDNERLRTYAASLLEPLRDLINPDAYDECVRRLCENLAAQTHQAGQIKPFTEELMPRTAEAIRSTRFAPHNTIR